MSSTPAGPEVATAVLIVEDQIGDLHWLTDLIEDRGYTYVVASSEKQAMARLDAVAEGREHYALAIIDVMVSTLDIDELLDLPDLDEKYFRDSRETGIRLCKYARMDRKITAEQLPIFCCTVRDDAEVADALQSLDIPHFLKDYEEDERSIRAEIQQRLPRRH